MQNLSLDRLYKMVAFIYSEQNLARGVATTFAHFVEVCGMLTMHDRKKRREAGQTVTDALCKALGWYFPLMAKLRIRSVEELIFRKYPYACPYCGLAPHRDSECKLVRCTGSTLNHPRLRELYAQNLGKKPDSLNGWQRMFQEIYPREADDRGRSTIGLFEELGEFAEAIRVSEKYPQYFLGEAADIFSYLMGIANEHDLRLVQEGGENFSFEREFLARYPGLCMQCGSRVCVCPTVPEATIGRMAKELDISAIENPFINDPMPFSDEGRRVAHHVLERVGGYEGLATGLPFDRGDVNHALVRLCLKIADAIHAERPDFADRLRAEAIQIGAAPSRPGTTGRKLHISELLRQISEIWRDLDLSLKLEMKGADEIVGEIADLMEISRILFVNCSPRDEMALRVSGELRVIREAIRAGAKGDKLVVNDLPAATIEDLRRALLATEYDVVHFSGHGDTESLVFETADGNATPVPLSAIATLIQRNPSIKCVILNACEALKALGAPIAPYTIGMKESISDDAAIEFSRGLYDALAAGKSVRFAVEEGINAVRLKNLDADPITVIKSPEP